MLVLVAACGGDGSPPKPTTAQFVFELAEGAADGDRRVIENVLTDVRAYFAAEMGSDIQRDVRVTIKPEDPLTGKTAYGGFSYMQFYTGAPGWTSWRNRRAESANASLIAHEYFHSLQWDLMAGEGEPKWQATSPPAWLVEGSADLASFRFAEHARYQKMQYAIDYYSELIAGKPQPRLGTVIVNSEANYAQAFLAVELLGRGHELRVFATFFTDAGTMDWRAAFAKNFGESVDAFIDRYEAGPSARTP